MIMLDAVPMLLMAMDAWAASPLSRSARRSVATRRAGSVVTAATMHPMTLPAKVIGAATIATLPASDGREVSSRPYSGSTVNSLATKDFDSSRRASS